MDQTGSAKIGRALLLPSSFRSTEANKTGSWRFLRPRYDEKTAPCAAACPAGEDIARIQMLTAQGLFKEAWETILRENPFPVVCGRVCYHPCEGVCNRGEFDSTVAVHVLERFLADTALRYDLQPLLERLPEKKEKIAVVGAGPSGLAAASFLRRLGYRCDVFEASSEPGGILRWGIPEYRLPLSALKSEIARIEGEGVRIFTDKPVSGNFLEEARGNYDAVFLGCGHGLASRLRIAGEGAAGVEDGLQFLAGIRRGEARQCEGLCAVIGGGNTAIDVARSVLRLGGRAVILYRRRRQDMPAAPEEVEAACEEGAELHEMLSPLKIAKDGKDLLVTMRRMKVAGEDAGGRARVEPDGRKAMEFRVRRVFIATGAEAAEDWLRPPEKERGVLSLDGCVLVHRPKRPVVVFGGDLVNSVKTVVHAVASGKAAAMALDTFFRAGIRAVRAGLRECAVANGASLSMEIYLGGPRRLRNPHVVGYSEINTDYFRFAPRVNQPRLLKEERLRSFAEIDLRISANLAIREAERCMNCGLCNRCDNCYFFCPDLAVIREADAAGRRINYDYCKGCGLCVVECPRNAMSLEEEGR
jgi:NADPH-dependent glutamate synthase beta subunit-like oxidoreductase/Pyruvate/2-oxoacid:ferredoxin oxidoreductase delta subunit